MILHINVDNINKFSQHLDTLMKVRNGVPLSSFDHTNLRDIEGLVKGLKADAQHRR